TPKPPRHPAPAPASLRKRAAPVCGGGPPIYLPRAFARGCGPFLQSFYTSTITYVPGARRIDIDAFKEAIMGLNNNQMAPYRDEHLCLDFDQQAAILDSQRIVLTRKEYDLLALLVQHAGEIIPRDALLLRVWGYGSEIRTRTLDVHVRRLRKKLGS